MPANKRMIQAHALTSIGIIAGFIFNGYLNGKAISEIYLFIIVLLLMYLPALLPPKQLAANENK
jgi:hypothetical protein